MEKDPETNLLNFELRQVDARLGRWCNTDPMGQHHSPYLSMSNNPVSFADPTGGWDEEAYGQSLYDRYTSQYNPNANSHSQFDNNYSNMSGPLGGSINPDGSFYSNNEQIYDAHQNYENRLSVARINANYEKSSGTDLGIATNQFPVAGTNGADPNGNIYSVGPGVAVGGKGSDRANTKAMYDYYLWKAAYYSKNYGPVLFRGVPVQDIDMGQAAKNAHIWKLYSKASYELADAAENTIIYTGVAFGAVVTGGAVAEAYGLYAGGAVGFSELKFAPKILSNSGPIIKSIGAASRAERLAIKLKLNINSATTRQVLNSLDDTVESFISLYRKPNIRSEFPGEFLGKTVEEALRSGNTTVRKLLTDSRFVK